MEIPQFSTDTEEDYKNRFAKYHNTLPELLIKTEKEIHTNIETIIRDYKGDFASFMKEYEAILKQNQIDMELIIKLWIYFKIKKDEPLELELELEDLKELLKSYKLSYVVDSIEKYNRKLFEIDYEKEKKRFKNNVERNDVIHYLLQETKEEPHSAFKKQKYNVDFMTSIKELSLDYIFSIIKCNNNIPFFMFKQICKISKTFKDYSFFEKWKTFDSIEKILLIVYTGKDYIDTYLSIKDNVLQVEASIFVDIPFDLKSFITKIFTIPITFGSTSNEYDIDGIVLFPNQRFNKYLLSDMIMNNPVFSKFIDVDESVKASTKKTGLLLKFKGSQKGDTSCNIICKKVIQNDPDIKEFNLGPKTLPVGSYYTRLRITKFKDIETVNYFVSLMSKFLTLYHHAPIIDFTIKNSPYSILEKYKRDQELLAQDENYLIQKYKEFLSDFTLIEKDIEDLKNKDLLEIKDTSFYTANYNRSCEAKRLPKILPFIKDEKRVEEKELKEYIVDTKPTKSNYYIKFPKQDEKKDEEIYGVTCYGNKEYPNIGLFENELENMDTYEYLPCCFKSQRNFNNFLDVYYGNKIKISGGQQTIITTFDRLLLPEIKKENVLAKHIGTLPNNLNTFLISLYGRFTTNEIVFYRQGISSEKHSFFDCIKAATGIKTDINLRDLTISSQENPDLTLEEMIQLFEDKTKYLDPKRWIRFMEYIFQCNIYVFSNYGKSKEASLSMPYHSGPYLQYKPSYKKTVFILENQNKKTKEFRCELIIMRELVEKDIEKDKCVFMENFPISFIDLYTQFYFLSGQEKPLIRYSPSPMNHIFSKHFTGQILDSYKKTRCLVLTLPTTQKEIYLVCNPIPPLSLPIIKRSDIETDSKNIIDFKDLFSLKIEIESTTTTIPLGMFTIHVKNKDVSTQLNTYEKNSRIATILGEFFIYVYSSYIHKNNKPMNDNYTIKSFIDETIVIIPNSHYEIIPSSIIDNETMIKYGYYTSEKIIVDNMETLKRLVCLLKLRILNATDEVKIYYTKKEFLNFYKNINDYDAFDNIILYTVDLEKIEGITTIVYNNLQDLNTYFLRIDKNIYIVKNIHDPTIIPDLTVKYNENNYENIHDLLSQKNIIDIKYETMSDQIVYQRLSLLK